MAKVPKKRSKKKKKAKGHIQLYADDGGSMLNVLYNRLYLVYCYDQDSLSSGLSALLGFMRDQVNFELEYTISGALESSSG